MSLMIERIKNHLKQRPITAWFVQLSIQAAAVICFFGAWEIWQGIGTSRWISLLFLINVFAGTVCMDWWHEFKKWRTGVSAKDIKDAASREEDWQCETIKNVQQRSF